MQTKLHNWAKADPGRRFDDLFNLVYDPAFLVVAWRRVRGNKGARTAGVDGVAPRSIASRAERLLNRLRGDLKARQFAPQRVREKTIPKSSGKIRRLGIPTTADRVVQASLKLVLEPRHACLGGAGESLKRAVPGDVVYRLTAVEVRACSRFLREDVAQAQGLVCLGPEFLPTWWPGLTREPRF